MKDSQASRSFTPSSRRADADAAEGRSPVAFADDHDHVRKLLGEDVLDEDEEAQESGAPAQPPVICTLVAYRTSSLHVPSTAKAGVSKGEYVLACVC